MILDVCLRALREVKAAYPLLNLDGFNVMQADAKGLDAPRFRRSGIAHRNYLIAETRDFKMNAHSLYHIPQMGYMSHRK